MVRVSRILKDYQETGAMHSLVGVQTAIDDHVFLTKSGDLAVFLSVQGVDSVCLDHGQLDHIARGFASAVSTLNEDFRLYQYLIKRHHPPLPFQSCGNLVADEAHSERIAYLQARDDKLYTIDTYFAILYSGWRPKAASAATILRDLLARPRLRLSQLLFPNESGRDFGEELQHAREVLMRQALGFQLQLQDILHAELLGKVGAYRFLRLLLNYAPYKEHSRLKYDDFVDYQACDSELECHRDHLRLDDYHVQVLTLKEPPAHTFAGMMKTLLTIPATGIIATEWKRESNATVQKLIRGKRRHYHNSKSSLLNYLGGAESVQAGNVLIDESATAMVHTLGTCLQELELQGRSFGEFALTIILYDASPTNLRRSVAECVKVFSTYDAHLTEERYNQLNAWLAVLPGNTAYNLRKLWLLDRNHADLSLLFAPDSGQRINRHLGKEYLALLETDVGTPHFLNLHVEDVAHTLIVGATGSGKSFLLNFLLTHLQKYDPLTFIFDLGGSYEDLTRLMRGAYVRIGSGAQEVKINPFCLPPREDNLQFLFAFIKVLIESSDFRMNAADDRDLYEQISNLYSVPTDQRRLFTLSNILNSRLRNQLQRWVLGGPFAALFDNVDDNLTFAPFQTFDFTGMDKTPDLLEPLLFYVLHRANASIDDKESSWRFKAFVIDEAWRFLRHPTIRQYITEALKTWRKRNSALILATQSVDDLASANVLQVVLESCPTKMFLANPGMDQSLYRDVFQLNDKEIAAIVNLTPKRQLLVKQVGPSCVLNLTVDPKGYWLYTNDPLDCQKKREAFERYGFKEGLEHLVRSKS